MVFDLIHTHNGWMAVFLGDALQQDAINILSAAAEGLSVSVSMLLEASAALPASEESKHLLMKTSP